MVDGRDEVEEFADKRGMVVLVVCTKLNDDLLLIG